MNRVPSSTLAFELSGHLDFDLLIHLLEEISLSFFLVEKLGLVKFAMGPISAL
jgi:hypothetical protein